jgi:hypothetical protein
MNWFYDNAGVSPSYSSSNTRHLISIETPLNLQESRLFDNSGRLTQDLQAGEQYQYRKEYPQLDKYVTNYGPTVQYIRVGSEGTLLARRSDVDGPPSLDFIGPLELSNSAIFEITIPEGRLYQDRNHNNTWRIEYQVRDHLNSLRLSFSSDKELYGYQNPTGTYPDQTPPTPPSPPSPPGPPGIGGGTSTNNVHKLTQTVTLELANADDEESNFDGVQDVRVVDPSNAMTGSAYGQICATCPDGSHQPLGPVKWFSVRQGDTVRLTTHMNYDLATSPSLFSTVLSLAPWLITQPIQTPGDHSALGSLPRLGVTLGLIQAIGRLFSPSPSAPNAFMRYIVYKTDTSYLTDGLVPITADAAGY